MAEPWWQQEPVPTGLTGGFTLLLWVLGQRVQARLKKRAEKQQQVDLEHELTDYAHTLRRAFMEATAVLLVRVARLEARLRDYDPEDPLLGEPAIPYPKPPDWPDSVPP